MRGHVVEHLEELLDAPGGLAGHPGLTGAAEGIEERQPVGRGPGVQPADGRGAHAPLGLVEHPLDRHLVDRVDDGPQVGDRVLDLLAVVEPGAAEHAVGDADPHELLFQDPALGVGAVEDGDVAPAQAAALAAAVHGIGHLHVVRVVEVGHLAGDPLGLVDLVVGVVADDGVAGALVGPQLLGLAADVVGDDGVGGVEDGLGRPVVLLEQHHRGVGERVLELHDVAHVGAPEGVDAVVNKNAIGDVGVGGLHLQVVDGAVVVVDLDSSTRASTSWINPSGISSRKRLGGLYCVPPNSVRLQAWVR